LAESGLLHDGSAADEADPEWACAVARYDYVVLNGAKWFTRPVVLHVRGHVLSCSDCGDPNGTYVPPHRAVRVSFRITLRALWEGPGVPRQGGRPDRGATAL
jgi:hypothetical protein